MNAQSRVQRDQQTRAESVLHGSHATRSPGCPALSISSQAARPLSAQHWYPTSNDKVRPQWVACPAKRFSSDAISSDGASGLKLPSVAGADGAGVLSHEKMEMSLAPMSKAPAIATLPITTYTPPPARCPIRAQVPMLIQVLPASMQRLEKPFSFHSLAPTSTISPHPLNATSNQNLLW